VEPWRHPVFFKEFAAGTKADPRLGNRRCRRCCDSAANRSIRRISRAERAVEGAVLDGFHQVGGLDALRSGQAGDGSRYFQDPVVGAGAKVELFHRHAEEFEGGAVESAVFAEGLVGEPGVEGDVPAVAFGLDGLAWSTRSRMACEDSESDRSAKCLNSTAGASTWISIRSSSGPEIRPRYFSTWFGVQRHSRFGSP